MGIDGNRWMGRGVFFGCAFWDGVLMCIGVLGDTLCVDFVFL